MIEIHDISTDDDTLGFSRNKKVKSGENIFNKYRKPLIKKICVDWDYCSQKNNPELQDNVTFLVTITDLISSMFGIIPPAAISVLLFKKGLNKLCNCSNKLLHKKND